MASRIIPTSCRGVAAWSFRAAAKPNYIRSFSSTARKASSTLQVHRDEPNNNPNIPFKFNETNQRLIEEILSRYPSQYKKAAVMPLLDLGQRQHGWTSISVMNEVARILGMPPMRVYEVATFYTMYNRTPVGRYHVQACTTTPCMLAGSDEVMRALKDHLKINPGETTADGIFTFSEVECLGACVNGPMIQINDDYYEDLTYETTTDLLKALQAAAETTGASGGPHGLAGQGKGPIKGEDRNVESRQDLADKFGAGYQADGAKLPSPGPMSGRRTCEPKTGQTTLLGEPPGTDIFRKDGEL